MLQNDEERKLAIKDSSFKKHKTTQLHKIIIVYKSTEMVVCEEVK